MSDATIAAGTEQRLTAQELKAQEKAAKKTEKERLKRVARDEKAERKSGCEVRLRERGEPAQEHAADHRVRAVRGVLPVPVRVPADQRHEDAGGLHVHVRSGLRPHVRFVGQHQDRVHLPGRHLRTLVPEHDPVRGRGRRRRDPARHHGRVRPGEVPFPGTQGRVRGDHRRHLACRASPWPCRSSCCSPS